jgi:release factor glutamine methyltransferase
MKSIGEILPLSVQYLEARNIASARRQVEELLCHILGLKRIELYMQFDRPLSEDELARLRELLRRRGKGEPLAYIVQQVDFYDCRLNVSPNVLIPRQETEILLDKVIQKLKKRSLQGKTAWDICAGSGSLAIGLKKSLPMLQVSLTDISSEALEVAKKNCEINCVTIELLQGDLLDPLKGRKADFILCNPPYISEQEYASLDPEVRDFEPKRALVGGGSGFEFYERLAAVLPGFLNPQGEVFFEIGTGQGERVAALFNASCWKTKYLEKDWAGHDRFFFLEIE